MTDLLEDYDNLPSDVKAIMDKVSQDATYEDNAKTIEELNKIGYTADYGLDSELYSLEKLPPFPLAIPSKMVSEFMRFDCYCSKDSYYPRPMDVKYISGERKREVYKAMKEIYYTDKPVRDWILKNIK